MCGLRDSLRGRETGFMMSHCTQYILSDHGETMGVERRQRPVRKPRDECDGVREELGKLPPPSCERGPGARCQCFGHGLKVEQSAQLAPRLVEEGSSHVFIELVAIPSSMSSSSRERSICCLRLWVANRSSPPGKDHAGSLAASSIACVSSVVVLPPKKKKKPAHPPE